MNVVVYRTAAKLAKGQKRTVCEVPVFGKGASATENSLITAGRSLFVENNYGYQDPFGPNTGAPDHPGFARVDVNSDGSGCKLRWTNTTDAAPSVVPRSRPRPACSTRTSRRPIPTARSRGTGRRSARTGKEAWRKLRGHRLRRTTTTTPGCPSALTAPRTWGPSAACRRCATPENAGKKTSGPSSWRAAQLRRAAARRAQTGDDGRASPSARSPNPGAMIAPGWAMQLLGDERLGRQQQRGDRRRVLERQPRHAHRVDHAGLEQVAELAGERVQAVAVGHRRAPGRSTAWPS